jgi:hypothetical protein
MTAITSMAIDQGKFNSVFSGFDPSTGTVESRTPSAMRAELPRRPIERIVIDSCSLGGLRRRCVPRNGASHE